MGRVGGAGAEFQSLNRCQSQSGDFADSVTAVQNLAVLRTFMDSSMQNTKCELLGTSGSFTRQVRKSLCLTYSVLVCFVCFAV